jgi:hypothetical protein
VREAQPLFDLGRSAPFPESWATTDLGPLGAYFLKDLRSRIRAHILGPFFEPPPVSAEK